MGECFLWFSDNSVQEEKEGEKGETEDGNVKVGNIVREDLLKF